MLLDQMGRQAQQDVTAEWTPCSDAGQTDTDHVRLAYHHQQALDDPDAVASIERIMTMGSTTLYRIAVPAVKNSA